MNTPTHKPIMVDLVALYGECRNVTERLTILRCAKLHFINVEEFALAARMRAIEKRIEKFEEDFYDFVKNELAKEEK